MPCAEAETAAAEGLWFIGFFCRPMLIGMVADQSKYLADRIAAELRHKEHLAVTTRIDDAAAVSGHQPWAGPHTILRRATSRLRGQHSSAASMFAESSG